MNISSTIRPQVAAPKQPQQSQKQEEPKEPWTQQAADYLEQSNDILTPKLAMYGGAASFALKGHQITESLHPVMKVVGIVGGGLLGAAVGHTAGTTLESANSWVTNKVFGDDTSFAKSLVSTGINTAAFGLVGGWAGAGLHAAFTVGGAATIARQDLGGQQ